MPTLHRLYGCAHRDALVVVCPPNEGIPQRPGRHATRSAAFAAVQRVGDRMEVRKLVQPIHVR